MPERRRFVLVSPNLYPRTCGVGDFSVRMGAELQRRGHDVSIVSRDPIEPHPEAPSLPVVGARGRLPTTIARAVAAEIRRLRPTDVLLQYTPQMWDASRFGSLALPWLATQARAAGAKVTFVAHELHMPFLRRPDLLAGALSQRLIFALLAKASDRVLVTTGSRALLADQVCSLIGAPRPGVIRVGANAPPVPRTRGSDPSRPRLGLFSTVAVGKRFDIVLDVFASVSAEIPGAELVLVGDLGPSERPGVRAVLDGIAHHPAHSRIRLTGKLPLSEVAQEIANFDLYLFPVDTGANTRSGTLPTALGSGLPIVAIRGQETDPELFRDGDNLVFASELTGPAFATATLRLLRDPALASRVSEGARSLYLEHLSWERIVDRFVEDEVI